MSDQPLYYNTFNNLIQEVLDYKKWKLVDLETATNIVRQTLTRYRYDESSPKGKIIIICIALGLDLVSTMIFLMSKGLTLNPIFDFDRKCMIFINNTKNDGLERVWEFDEYMNK